jgi:hypothetical protein
VSRTVDLLRPGIAALFARKGYTAEAYQDPKTAKLVVLVTKGETYHEAHSYDMPSINSEISAQLRAWLADLP